MRILLSNDDGIGSEGLQALHDALAPSAEVWVVRALHPRSIVGPVHVEDRTTTREDALAAQVGRPPAVGGWTAVGAPVLLVPELAHAAGEGLPIIEDMWIVAAVVGAVSLLLALATAKTGNRGLFVASLAVGALPAMLGFASVVSFVGSAGIAGLALGGPFYVVVGALAWAWSVAYRRVKLRRQDLANADAWLTKKRREADARRPPAPPDV